MPAGATEASNATHCFDFVCLITSARDRFHIGDAAVGVEASTASFLVEVLQCVGHNLADPFGIKQRGPGAFELAARINELRVDPNAFPLYADPTKSARHALAWGLQLNWFFSRNFRFGAMYERTIFDGGAAKGGFRETENVLIGRLQAAF